MSARLAFNGQSGLGFMSWAFVVEARGLRECRGSLFFDRWHLMDVYPDTAAASVKAAELRAAGEVVRVRPILRQDA